MQAGSELGEEDLGRLTIIRAARWAPLNLRELWEFRELVVFMLWRQLQGDYRQMALGPLWIVLKPLMGTFIFTLIFGMIAKIETPVPYPLFCYSALLPWTFFAGATAGAANSLLEHRQLLSKVYFPRLVVPIVSVAGGLVHFAASFLLLLLLMAYYGYAPSWELVYLPLYVGLASLLALAVGLWLAPVIVHYRDMANALDYALAGWMYATPVVYALKEIPPAWHDVYRLNPMTNVVQGFRWALLGGQVGDAPNVMLLVSAGLILPLLVGGAYAYRRAERSIVDIA